MKVKAVYDVRFGDGTRAVLVMQEDTGNAPECKSYEVEYLQG